MNKTNNLKKDLLRKGRSIRAHGAVSQPFVALLSTQTHHIGPTLCTLIGLQLGSVNIVKVGEEWPPPLPLLMELSALVCCPGVL